MLASLHEGDGVTLVGYERTVSGGEGENHRTGRTLEANAIGRNHTRATAVVTTTFLRPPRRDRCGVTEAAAETSPQKAIYSRFAVASIQSVTSSSKV